MILESCRQTYIVAVGGLGGKLVCETLLLPSRGFGRSVVFAARACPYAREPLVVSTNAVS